MKVSEEPSGQEGKHLPTGNNGTRMEMSKGQVDKRESTYILVTDGDE